MSIDLHKKAERAGIVLKKQGISNPPRLRVGLMMDISGSMRNLYEDGTVQKVVDNTLGLAMPFDPSHSLDVFVFDDQYAQLPVAATLSNYNTYVDRQIMTESAIPKWGSTEYGGVIHQFQDHYFGEDDNHTEHRRDNPGKVQKAGFFKRLFGGNTSLLPQQVTGNNRPDPAWANIPVLGILITDGENSDPVTAERAITRSEDFPIFWCLVGVGHHSFSFLKQMNRKHDDVEFVNLENLYISDEYLYSQLVSSKLTKWLKAHPEGSGSTYGDAIDYRTMNRYS